MPPLTAEERRERVRRVQDAAADLQNVENAIDDMLARLPALRRKVGEIRTTITEALEPPREEAPNAGDNGSA